MSEPIELCDVEDLAEGELAAAEIEGREFVYTRIADQFFAIDGICTHAHVRLVDGIVDEDECTLECPKHGASFSLATGEALTLPAIKPVLAHSIEIRESAVFVTLTEEDE